MLGFSEVSLKALAALGFLMGLDRRSLTSAVRLGFGSVVISCRCEFSNPVISQRIISSYLE
jgi:hypothetical protein